MNAFEVFLLATASALTPWIIYGAYTLIGKRS